MSVDITRAPVGLQLGLHRILKQYRLRRTIQRPGITRFWPILLEAAVQYRVGVSSFEANRSKAGEAKRLHHQQQATTILHSTLFVIQHLPTVLCLCGWHVVDFSLRNHNAVQVALPGSMENQDRRRHRRTSREEEEEESCPVCTQVVLYIRSVMTMQ